MPKSLTRRSAIVMAIGFGVLLIIALTRAGGGTATISARGVGPLVIGKSSRTAVQNFGRGPESFWLSQRGNPPLRFNGQLWQYKCVGQNTTFGVTCRTLYGITHGHLATVETNSSQFYTKAGTRIGTTLPQARKNEQHARWSGWQAACPHLTMPSAKGVTFFVSVSRNAVNPQGFVNGFYLSATPSSFSYCAGP
ncbi:MAG: hypothetical protein WBQ14_09955 [Gaiellaceae bacterium]